MQHRRSMEGDEARQAKWAPKGHSRRRAQAGGHSAPHVDRPNRVQLVEEGGCRVTSNNEIKGFPQHGGKRCPCRDDGGGEIARFFARLSIREIALATLIHQRRLTPSCGGPYGGENNGPGKDDRGGPMPK